MRCIGHDIRLGTALAAVAFGVLGAATASAQSAPPPPRQSQSTELTAPADAGSSLVVDFSQPKGEAVPKPEPPERPESAPAADVHGAPGHTCTTGDPGVDAIVREAGVRYGVDPCLVNAVMAAESAYRRYAVSPKGACGYMQLMPATAARFGVADIFDARQNIHAGTRYLRFLLDRFGGSLELALAGYNAGEGAVERYGKRIPPFAETQNYVRIIAGRYLSRHAGAVAYRPGVAPPAPVAAAASAASTRPAVAWRISVEFDQE